MKRRIAVAAALSVIAAAIAACSMDSDYQSESIDDAAEAVTAAGPVPAGLPAHVLVGLFEDSGGTWMKSSGVPWDARYRYFTKGWVENWGWSAYDGSFGLQYMQECSAQGYVPAIQYYQMNAEPGGGEAQFLTKVQNSTTMASYFNDFKILMQRVKELGKPTFVLLEADGFPSSAVPPLAQLGVEFTTNATWSGAAYIDAVNW